MRKTITAVSYTADHGDGGGHSSIYPDLKTLKKEEGLDAKRYKSALNGDSPYEDGEINQNVKIEVEVLDNGEIKLAKSINVSYGQ